MRPFWLAGSLSLGAALAPALAAEPGEARESVAQEGGAAPQAPDGKRGFGVDLKQKELSKLLKSNAPADRAFFAELDELALTARVRLLGLRQHYAARGYFRLLPGSAGDDLDLLHQTYAKLRDDPGATLGANDARAKALSGMIVDTKFNVRRELAVRAAMAVLDLEHARAVFGATQDGYVDLSPSELVHLGARADLAAAELRALRSDLEALAPQAADKLPTEEEAALAKRLLEVARNSDARARAADIRTVAIPRAELETRMQGMLFSARPSCGRCANGASARSPRRPISRSACSSSCRTRRRARRRGPTSRS